MTTEINLQKIIDSETLKKAEEILERSGITVEELIAGIFARTARKQELPFEQKKYIRKPLNADELTAEQFMAEIKKGLDDMENGRVYTDEEAYDEIERFIESL